MIYRCGYARTAPVENRAASIATYRWLDLMPAASVRPAGHPYHVVWLAGGLSPVEPFLSMALDLIVRIAFENDKNVISAARL